MWIRLKWLRTQSNTLFLKPAINFSGLIKQHLFTNSITVQVKHRTVQLVMVKPNYVSYAGLNAVIALRTFCGCNIIGEGEGPGIAWHFKVTTLGFRQSLCVKLPRNNERGFFNENSYYWLRPHNVPEFRRRIVVVATCYEENDSWCSTFI